MKKLPRSKCIICNTECKRSTTKTCSIKCRALLQKGKRFGGPKRKVQSRPCKTCNKIFYPIGYKEAAKYCNRSCMGKARADFCAELGKKMRGRKLSKEVKRKLSISASKRNAQTQYTKGRGGTRKDLGHYLRSRWEANVARYLLLTVGKYEYEPETFSLDAGDRFYCYTPDFKVGDVYYEVKGYWDQKSLIKKKLFNEQYKDIKIIYLDPPEYYKIRDMYAKTIKNWEY